MDLSQGISLGFAVIALTFFALRWWHGRNWRKISTPEEMRLAEKMRREMHAASDWVEHLREVDRAKTRVQMDRV